jgi:hypothetical protein
MEDWVLKGAASTIRRCHPVIYAECNSLGDGLRALAVLKEMQYRVRAHVVRAYNVDNFRGDAENFLGEACEVALVGTPQVPDRDPLLGYFIRSCELLLDIETPDDLALALFNKPQYEQEVLRIGAAALSGGAKCLDEIRVLRSAMVDLAKLTQQHETEMDALRRNHAEEMIAIKQNFEERLAAKLESVAGRIATLENELYGIHGSISWRIMAPFRVVKRMLARG